MNQALSRKLTAAAAAAAAVCLLVFAPQTAEGVRHGLSLCGGALIPSLFPFMALALFVGCSPAAGVLAGLADPLCRRWLRLPGQLGPVVLMSLIGGYPVGARMLGDLLRQKRITPEEALRCLQFAVFPAPSFALVTVGAGILGSVKAGAVLFGAHLLWALVLGRMQGRRHPLPPPVPLAGSPCLPPGTALVEGTAAAVEGMLSICGFALVFSALAAVPRHLGLEGVPLALLWGLLEVTGGVFACGGLNWTAAAFLVPFLVSFGSVSVLCQLAVCLDCPALSPGALLKGRLAQGLLCSLTAGPLLLGLAPAQAAWQTAVQPLAGPSSVLSSAALLGLCSLLLFGLAPARPQPDKF